MTQVVALCLCPLAWALERTLRIPYHGHHMSGHWPIRTKTNLIQTQPTLMTPAKWNINFLLNRRTMLMEKIKTPAKVLLLFLADVLNSNNVSANLP